MFTNQTFVFSSFCKAITITALICILFSIGFANDLSKENAFQNEANAVRLSRIWELESIKRAAVAFEKTAEDWTKLSEPQRAAFCLNEAAKLAQIISDYEFGFRLLNKAIKIESANNLTDEKIVTLSLYSLLSHQKGDKKNSLNFSLKALDLHNKTASPTAKAYALFCSGIYEYYYGKIRNATNLFEQAEAFMRESDDIFLVSQVLFYTSFSYLREGIAYQAIDKMNLALRLCERYEYQRGIALSYTGIGYINYFLSEKQKALNFFQKSQSLFPADFEWMEKARAVNAMGLIYKGFGEYDLAENSFQKAVEFYQQADYPVGKITALNSLAEVLTEKSLFDKALQTYAAAQKITMEIGDKFSLTSIKEGVGYIRLKENDYDAAIDNYLEAKRIYNEVGVKYPPVENLLGIAYERKNDFVTARNYFQEASKTNQETRNYLQLSENLYNLANLDFRESDLNASLEKIKRSIELTENLYLDVDNSKLKGSYLASVFDRYALYINILMKLCRRNSDESFASEALLAAEKSRARLISENLEFSEADFTKDADPELLKREKEIRVLLNTKADKLTDLLSQNADKSETDKIANEINELENDLGEIRANLKQNSPAYYAIKNPPAFDVGEFQKNVLDDDTLLLEYSFGDDESYLWAIGKTEFDSFVLPPREQIESQIQILRQLLASRAMTGGETIEAFQERIKKADADFRQTAKDLSGELFGQVADKLGNKRLLIVPDGKLNYFPVSALPLPNSETDEPILLTNEVVYEPSASTLSILAKNDSRNKTAEKSLLIFSDPVFTADDARLSAENRIDSPEKSDSGEKFRFVESLNSLARLDSSKTEADSIIDILGRTNVDDFSGFSANRERLLKVDAGDYKILHFATHGLIDEKRPELSGIVLSRFDENGRKLDEFFRLHDIYGMNLNSDLVVLSACNTGIGKEVRGEGLMSLNNAFLSVGAKSVVASLWKVEDGATLELMKNFYGEMASENLAPSKALQKAQIKLRQSGRYKSPFYWAAFTVQGDYKHAPNLSKGFSFTILYSAIFSFVLLFGIFVFYKFRNGKSKLPNRK